MTSTATLTAVQLLRTTSGGRLHTAECPHLRGRSHSPADVRDTQVASVCRHCQDEIDGVGRRWFDDLDDALCSFHLPVHVVAEARRIVSRVAHDAVWVPRSAAYIAVGLDGQAVATVGPSYVWLRTHGFIELTDHRQGTAALL